LFLVGGDELPPDDKKKKQPQNEDFIPLEEMDAEYSGSVDWDAEWKKVVKNKDAILEKAPGKDFYKSDAEIAAIVRRNGYASCL
jgi:hypothetical protein